jgi:hypothetical protein
MWSRNWLPFRSTWVHPGFSGVNSCWTIFSFLNNVFVDRVCSFSFGRCVVCLSFYLRYLITPYLRHLITLYLRHLITPLFMASDYPLFTASDYPLFTASDYPFIYGIWLPLYLRHLITPYLRHLITPLFTVSDYPFIYGISLPLWYIQAFLKELQWYVQFHSEITFLIWLSGLHGW